MVLRLIGGELVEGSRTLDVVDPCTGVAFTQVPDAAAADVERAVAAAKAAFPARRYLAPGARGAVLRAMAATVAVYAEGPYEWKRVVEGQSVAVSVDLMDGRTKKK